MLTRKIVIPIGLITLAIIASFFFISLNKKPDNLKNGNVNNIELVDFTAQEIGVKITYPKNWQRYYNPPEDNFVFALELSSDVQTNDIDPETDQKLNGPLIKISVYQQNNFEQVELGKWISDTTAVDDEQTRIRKDNDGWFGIRQWVWHKSNIYAFSAISYYIQKDNDFWEFRADINQDDPNTNQFKEAVETVDQIFDSIEFVN